ncbi:VUT family protein [Paenibacillus sp. Marseille-P2973]|uniref:VUT family protein n=1 Tax=Paenibacillus sp. Marseille-P2973 TaxID=1871032 RepID=UPI001B3801B5|nr:VUT family protein [Paenibacillus sp. Marseille-P2973]MBQ4899866.1 VUT family protein [Paenibacillus sp. Marseille-P2973]
MKKVVVVLCYLLAIVSANVVTASTVPFQFGIFIVPAGTFIIGLTFILRDFVQSLIGKKKTYYTISCAIVLSAISSYALGDTLWIVFASILTFLVSETTDTEIYSRLRLPFAWRVAYSGIVGGFLDSIIFVVVGLSPLGANFLPWSAVGYAIIGQIIVKTVVQLIGAIFVKMTMQRISKFIQ